MGLFDKIKGIVNGKIEQITQKQEEDKKKQEEDKKKQEEERRKREEANRYNPEGKSLEWFASEDGLKAFNEYMTPQNYLLEETIRKEKEEKYRQYDFEVVVNVFHKQAKIPYIFFKNLIKNIDVQPLKYVGPINMLINVLSVQAKPFYFDDDGEPQPRERLLREDEIISIDKNPVLNYVSNFNCFELKDDVQGSWNDKWNMWSEMLIWIGVYADKEFIANNSWIFSNDTYFNNMGTVRKIKGFYKKCIELADNKEYFEQKLNKCE